MERLFANRSRQSLTAQKKIAIPLKGVVTFGTVALSALLFSFAPDLSLYDYATGNEKKNDDVAVAPESGVTVGSSEIGNTASDSNQPVFTLLGHKLFADDAFKELMTEAGAFRSSLPKRKHMMEVGMHSPFQCRRAAENGLIAHCIEPSPKSRERIENKINNQEPAIRQNIRFYQLAGSATSGVELPFNSAGGTGDHVGEGGIDMWSMTKSEPNPEQEGNMVTVKSVSIDDILKNKIEPTIDYEMKETGKSLETIENLYLLKVDVQGHEPPVFEGAHESIREHKIDMILLEYWPKGMDFLNDNLGTDRQCQVPVKMLRPILDAGYKLYALGAMSHPGAPRDESGELLYEYNRGRVTDHLNSLEDHCNWFYQLESLRSEKMEDGQMYEMGFWTDILAVRPGFRFPTPPTTPLGRALMGEEAVRRT